MPYSKIHTATLIGSKVYPVSIEVDIQPGLPYFSIIGLPDRRIEESKERIRSAIKNSGLQFPLGKITVNLSPSDLPKHGTGFDLGIAVGILQATEQFKGRVEGWIIGELSLNGQVNAVHRLTPLLLESVKCNIVGCIIPSKNILNSRLVYEAQVMRVSCLKDMLGAPIKYTASVPLLPVKGSSSKAYSFDLVRGQEGAKRALTISLAGGHNLFMSGPPGSGKTMLGMASIELLPSLTREEILVLAGLHAAADLPFDLSNPIRPLRAPHYSISERSLLGGGLRGYPGEMSLAEKGILFLDEFSEMKRTVREGLRQPMQENQIVFQRMGIQYQFPASCLIIAAQNNCPCGMKEKGTECKCTPGEIERYEKRISESLYDRFALFCHTEKLEMEEWETQEKRGDKVAQSIALARATQCKRLGEGRVNSDMSNAELKQLLQIDRLAFDYINTVSKKIFISGRGMRNVLCVARTIADLEGKEGVELAHFQEAVQYRKR